MRASPAASWPNRSATPSAPTERAAESPGTNTVTGSATGWHQLIETGRIEPPHQCSVDLRRWPQRAVAEAENLVERYRAVGRCLPEVDAEAGLRVLRQLAAPHRLARLGSTDPHRLAAPRRLMEILVERERAPHFGLRKVEGVGQHPDRIGRQVADLVLQVMEDGQQRSALGLVGRHDATHVALELLTIHDRRLLSTSQ